MAGVSGPMAWSSSCDVVFQFPRDWRSRTHRWHRPQNSFCWQKTGVWDGDSIAALFEAKEACDLVLKQMPENTKARGKWLIQQCPGLMSWQNIVYDVYDSMILWMSRQNMDWFLGFGQYDTEQTQSTRVQYLTFCIPWTNITGIPKQTRWMSWDQRDQTVGCSMVWPAHGAGVVPSSASSNAATWICGGQILESPFGAFTARDSLAIFCSIVRGSLTIQRHRKDIFCVEVLGIRFESMKMLALRHAKTYAGSSTSIPTYRTENGWLYNCATAVAGLPRRHSFFVLFCCLIRYCIFQ